MWIEIKTATRGYFYMVYQCRNAIYINDFEQIDGKIEKL